MNKLKVLQMRGCGMALNDQPDDPDQSEDRHPDIEQIDGLGMGEGSASAEDMGGQSGKRKGGFGTLKREGGALVLSVSRN